MPESSKALAFIYQDQLSLNLTSLKALEDFQHKHVLFIECPGESTNVPHHKQKLVLWFTAMRKFSKQLQDKGYTTHYIDLENKQNQGQIQKTLQSFIAQNKFTNIFVTHPSEYRQLNDIKSISTPVSILPDKRFISHDFDFKGYASKRKKLIMEFFYRLMRQKTNILMQENGKPIQDQWNFDKDNRKPFTKDIPTFNPINHKACEITQEVIKLVNKHFPENFGTTDNFNYATSSDQARKVLNHFIKNALPHFGDYQDMMDQNNPFLFHSLISPYINLGLLDPLDVIKKAEKAYLDGLAPINAAEGFIRQILGWREFVYSIYWLYMPKYLESNHLKHTSKLPQFYWNADTKMNCVKSCVNFTHDYAYSHHIQRLMVTGNLALLMQINPDLVHQWYLAVYIDAYEWVELPNTIGMSLFADGGILGTKPYCSSGNYINKMSNFCKDCHYNVKEKLGPTACPFNYLYWNFLSTHKKILQDNPRLKFAYNNLNKMDPKQLKAIQTQSQEFLKSTPVY